MVKTEAKWSPYALSSVLFLSVSLSRPSHQCMQTPAPFSGQETYIPSNDTARASALCEACTDQVI